MMATPPGTATFTGSIPQLYERLLVPLIFTPYAIDLGQRAMVRRPDRVLEIAAGTGVVTRQLAQRLPPATDIVATDLSTPMLECAAAIGTSRHVEWRQADAQQLPFAAAEFDLVVCQFGAMFFPERPGAYAEVRRVLRPGGAFLFNVWERLELNEFAATVTDALAALYADDPPRFMAQVPHGYHDRVLIAQDLASAGFSQQADFTTLAARSRASEARVPAIAFCQGTPMRGEIEAREPAGLERATAAAAVALARRFGNGAVDGGIQATIITVERGTDDE